MYEAARRFRAGMGITGERDPGVGAGEDPNYQLEAERPGVLLYLGDHDPSGEDMVRSLRERLAFFGCNPKIIKCALTLEDVKEYNLPPDLAKKTDTRRAAFVEKYGDACVELDALPAAVLQTRLKNDIETRFDLDALELVKLAERADKENLRELLGGEV
jgi:hypothetical protein